MGRRQWIDRKTAAHFTLVHRPQNDPRIHDEAAPAMVLNPTQLGNAAGGGGSSVAGSRRSKRLDDLASQLGSEVASIRANEGEAAAYGVYFDDSAYDYMQHLRDMGQGGGDAVFVEAPAPAKKGAAATRGKQPSLADALQRLDLQNQSEALLDADMLPSKTLRRVTYQNQQDVPDAIAGFQPDMDPRLREVLEALEDDAYVVADDDEAAAEEADLFQQLAKDGEELDAYEFEATYGDDDDDDGWASDATEKPAKPSTARQRDDEAPALVDVSGGAAAAAEAESTQQPAAADAAADAPSDAWMEGFKQFKKDQSSAAAAGARRRIVPALSDIQSSIWTTDTAGGRKKKRKGALTQQSGFSMTSSSLVRTEQLTLLDARFDKIDEAYNEDAGGDDLQSESGVSAFSSASSVQGPLRSDFDGILDEFLGGYSMQGKRAVKKGRQQSGLEQLEEIRRGLGPARLPARTRR